MQSFPFFIPSSLFRSRDGDGGRLFQKVSPRESNFPHRIFIVPNAISAPSPQFRAAAPDTVDDAELRDIIKKNNSNEEAIERVIDDLWQSTFSRVMCLLFHESRS